ncbi:MAG: ribonuclease P protein component [Casimicrobiaceae bacterium]|nr:ribonuclease P protein component [Casimicrobiaceae bacterium]MCX8098996.1 ribonuclease P protein component [Casimicrobiaceae bacterium]MDW8311476.1 ribonuclease P protein component [Burkholderiales bacterium]
MVVSCLKPRSTSGEAQTAGSAAARARQADLRFPRTARLTRAEEFDAVLKTRPVRARWLWLYRMTPPNDSASLYPRLGLMVSKKLARTAVLRNAVKRRLREQFRLRRPLLPPRWYVARLVARVERSQLPEIVTEWQQLLDAELRRGPGRTP